jgi:hypothetical protein
LRISEFACLPVGRDCGIFWDLKSAIYNPHSAL